MPTIKEIQVNGKKYQIHAASQRNLLSVLRDDLDLTGSKYGCGEGQCGACTVLADGQPVRSCLMSVEIAADKQITTIEGLASNQRLHPLQQAFLDADALQCGYCTSGMIMSAVALLSKHPDPGELEIVRFMNGNLCRCGVYARIVLAIHKAAGSLKGGGQ